MSTNWDDFSPVKDEFEGLEPVDWAQFEPAVTDTGDESARLAKRFPAPARGGKRSEFKPFVAGTQPTATEYPTFREAGNIDLSKRPVVKNPDGTTSTIRSFSTNIDGDEVLLPSISDDGRALTDDQAIALYQKTGKHLGKFADARSADLYAKSLSEQQGKRVLDGEVPAAEGGRGKVIPRTVAQMKRDEQAATPRTWSEASLDFATALGKGGNSLMTLPLALVAPGSKQYNWVKENGKALEEMESPTLKAQRAQIAEMIANDPDEMAKFVTSVRESLSNPAVAFSTMVEQLPMMGALLATGGTGAVIGRAAVAPIGVRAITAGAQRVGAGLGMAGGGAVAAGGDAASDTFDRLIDPKQTPDDLFEQNSDYNAMIVRGATPAEARQAIAESKSKLAAALAAPLGAISGVVGLKVPGTGSVVGKGGVLAGSRAVATELTGEVAEELGTKGAGNYAVQTINPEQSLTQGFGETAAQALIGSAGPAVLAGVQRGLPPVKAEDMPADRVLTPEELAPEAVKGAAVRAAEQAAQAQAGVPAEGVGVARPIPEPPAVPPVTPTEAPLAPARATGEKIGVANVPQGEMASRVDDLMRQRAGESNEGRGGVPVERAVGVGEQGAPDAGGGVVDAGRAADPTTGPVAGEDATAGAAPATGVPANRANAPSVASLKTDYESRRQKASAEADRLESQSRQWAATGLRDKAKQAAEKAAAKRASAAQLPIMEEPTPGPALDQANRLFDALEKVTGHRPVAYSSNGRGVIDGFSDDSNGVTAVDISGAEMPVPFTVFHEFTHRVQDLATQGDAAAKRAEAAMDTIWEMISPEGKKTYASKYLFKASIDENTPVEAVLGDAKKLKVLKREMLADFMGSRATDKRFLKKLAKRDPENFGDFVKQWVKVLTDLIAELKGSGKAGVKDVDQYIAQLEEAKAAAEEALVEWSALGKGDSGNGAVSASPRTEPAPRGFPPIQYKESEKKPKDEGLGAFNIDRNDEDISPDWEDEPIPVGEATEVATPAKVSLADLERTPEDAIRFIAQVRSMTPDAVLADYGFGDKDDYIKLADELVDSSDARRQKLTFPPPLPRIDGGLSEAEMAAITAELEAANSVTQVRRVSPAQIRAQEAIDAEGAKLAPGARAVSFTEVSDQNIAASGIMAESAYPDPQYRVSGYDLVADVTLEGGTVQISVPPREGRSQYGNAFQYARGAVTTAARRNAGTDQGLAAANFGEGTNSLSTEQSKKLAKIFTASADLYARKFDLFTSVPSAGRNRVISAWKKLSSLSKAFEFGSVPADLKGSKKTGETMTKRTRLIAESILKGSTFTPTINAPDSYGGNSVSITLKDNRTGTTGDATIEFVGASEGGPKFVMHTAGFKAGSSMGKPFYQVAFGVANAMGDIPVEADGILLGVNNYRRTEQMMSAAARNGMASVVNPGVGQRVYGWNRRPKGQDQQDRNFARTAMAQARNAAEFVPEVPMLRYDPQQDSFSWPDGSSAEVFVKDALANPDVRLVSISRSTLARAAITFAAIDGSLDLDGVTEVASPVLYSAREGGYADSSKQSSDGYSRLEGRRVSYEVRIADTGEVATVTVQAREAMLSLDERIETMRSLIGCLGR